jgi:hypothetical protein
MIKLRSVRWGRHAERMRTKMNSFRTCGKIRKREATVVACVIYSSDFLVTDPVVLNSIPDGTRFSEIYASGTGSIQPREDN